jgi:hypothetical protein
MKTLADNIKAVLLFLLLLLIYTGGVIYLYHKHELKNAKTVITQTPVTISPVIAPKHEVHAASKPDKPDTTVSALHLIIGRFYGLSDSLETLKVSNDSLINLLASSFYPRWTVFNDTTVCGDSTYSFSMIQQNRVGFSFFPDSISKDLIYKTFKLTLNMENITKTIPPNYSFWDWIAYKFTWLLAGIAVVVLAVK